ncbi:hypothetical protein [Bacillus mycoides]|uniref:hypothetical protein n=1 Tax=Bacillus mycoides TaxID=1405 RepID=UPI003D1D79D8
MIKSNLNKNIITNIFFQVINIAYGLILPRLIIVNYGSEINGLVSAALQIIGYMKIVEAGLSTASIRQFYAPLANKNAREISDLFQSINYYYRKIANYFMLISFIGAGIYAFLANTSINNVYVFLLVIVIALSTYLDFSFSTKYYIYFLANKEVFKYQIPQILAQIIKILVTLIGIYYDFDIVMLLLILSLVVLLKMPILNMFFKHENIVLKSEYQLIKIEQRDSVLIHQILGLIIYNGPIILISIFIDTNFASIFAVYNLIFGTFYSFFNLIYGQSLLPQLGHALSTKKEANIKNMHEKFNKYGILIILILMITTSVMFKTFIQIYTSGADIDYYSYTTMLLFLWYTFINCLKVPYQTLVNANGNFQKTIIHSIIEVIVFILIILIFWSKISIDIFVLGLLLSSIYKMVSLKIFSNIHIVKESWKQHYFQIIGLIVLLIISISISVTTKINLNINNLFEWVISSMFTVIIASVLSIVIIILPELILSKVIRK